jgi:hypothetical protein
MATDVELVQSLNPKGGGKGAPSWVQSHTKVKLSLPPYIPYDLDAQGYAQSIEMQNKALATLLTLEFGEFLR